MQNMRMKGRSKGGERYKSPQEYAYRGALPAGGRSRGGAGILGEVVTLSMTLNGVAVDIHDAVHI